MAEPFREGDDLLPTITGWPDPDGGPWWLALYWKVLNGRAECVGMTIVSTSVSDVPAMSPNLRSQPGMPITTATLRALRLSELVAQARVDLADLPIANPGWSELHSQRRLEMRESTRKRLRLVANTYTEAWKHGEPPTRAVAKRLRVTEAAASGLVSRARAAGMLPPTSPGVAAGQAPTPPE